MNLIPPIRTLLLLLAATTLHAQTDTPKPPDTAAPITKPKPKPHPPKPDAPLFNLDTILLDPAHGGPDNGAKITDVALEKDVTLAFANRLKGLLTTRGFNVIMTRTADLPQPRPDDPPPLHPPTPFNDQRVELANRSHAVACLLIHASNGGHGVHILTSSLTPPPELPPDPDQAKPIIPWDTAQSASLPNSLRLANDLATAFNNIRIPLVLARASVPPIDSMTCPAIALELSPLATADGQTPASDDAYQSRVADAVASALVFWRGHAQSLAAAAQAAKSNATPATAPPASKKPKPKLITPPVEVPDEPGPPHTPAPIVRKTPSADPPPPPPGAHPQ